MIRTLRIFLFLAGVRSVWLVEPPKNVTIHCQNGTNIAYWNHSGSSEVLFNVMIKSYQDGTTSQLNTSQRQIDISSITPPRDMEEYTFSVAALEGVNKSDVVPVDFTYARDFAPLVKHTCFMAFPTPNVSAEASKIKFSFAKPHYRSSISYTVSTSHDEPPLHLECPPEAVVCHGEIQLNISSMKNCTTLKLEGVINGILYKTSEKMCSIEKGSWPIFLCVVICVIALATLVGILLSARKVIKSLIEQSSSFVPTSLNSPRISGSPKLLHPEPTITSHAQTGSTPLLQMPENSPTDVETFIPTESCLDRTHFPILDPAPSSGDQLGDGYEARNKSDFEGSDDGYMQRERIPDTPDSSSVNGIAIEIAPGDNVSGYGPL